MVTEEPRLRPPLELALDEPPEENADAIAAHSVGCRRHRAATAAGLGTVIVLMTRPSAARQMIVGSTGALRALATSLAGSRATNTLPTTDPVAVAAFRAPTAGNLSVTDATPSGTTQLSVD